MKKIMFMGLMSLFVFACGKKEEKVDLSKLSTQEKFDHYLCQAYKSKDNKEEFEKISKQLDSIQVVLMDENRKEERDIEVSTGIVAKSLVRAEACGVKQDEYFAFLISEGKSFDAKKYDYITMLVEQGEIMAKILQATDKEARMKLYPEMKKSNDQAAEVFKDKSMVEAMTASMIPAIVVKKKNLDLGNEKLLELQLEYIELYPPVFNETLGDE